MTNEQINLRNELVNELKARGFKFLGYCGETIATLYLEGHYEEREYNLWEGSNHTPYMLRGSFGYSIEVVETYRNNRTSENKSYYIWVQNWDKSSGKGIERVKISQKDGAKKRQNAIDKIVNAYMEAIKQ